MIATTGGHDALNDNLPSTWVSLTFDDGLDVHLDAAMPILEAQGMRGTFYVNAGGNCLAERHGEWTAAARRGHELGNHTVFHPGVSSKSWVTDGIAIEAYTLDRMRHELVVANRMLHVIDGRDERSFAFPCSNPWLGRPGWPRRLLTGMKLERTRLMGFVDRHKLDIGSRLTDYTPLARELFPAARCGGIAAQDLPVRPTDRHRVRAVDGDGQSYATLSATLEIAIARRAWVVYVFHGVGGGHHLSVERGVFEDFVAHLASEPRIRVLPFLDAAKALLAGESSSRA